MTIEADERSTQPLGQLQIGCVGTSWALAANAPMLGSIVCNLVGDLVYSCRRGEWSQP